MCSHSMYLWVWRSCKQAYEIEDITCVQLEYRILGCIKHETHSKNYPSLLEFIDYVCYLLRLWYVIYMHNTACFYLLIGSDIPVQCCICQEDCVNPVKLPCDHMFCYLCLKGVAVRSYRCALCRSPIPHGYIDKPAVVNEDEIKSTLQQSLASYNWFYEAKSGGWWMYEKRTSSEIENAYSEQKKTLRIQISGFFYIVDFDKMVQFREDIPSRQRRIKRDVVRTEDVKGVAGISVQGDAEQERSKLVTGFD